MNIKILKIKNKSDSCKIDYLINGSKRSLTSDQKLSDGFIKALSNLRPIALSICQLDDLVGYYEVTGLSIPRKSTEEGENKAVVISMKKSVEGGTLNISTPKRWLECDKEDANLLDDISANIIQEACKFAAAFIRADSIHRELYSQAELSLGENPEAMES